MIQLLLADSHQLLHPGIQSILMPSTEITLIGTATNETQLRHHCNQYQPDVLLLALNITESPYTDVLGFLQHKHPKTKILILLHCANEARLRDLMEMGVSGCILKSDAPEKLIDAIQVTATGEKWFSPTLTSQLLQLRNSNQENRLTNREVEVLQLVASEKTVKEIALALGIAEGTVRFHLENIHIRLGTTTRVGAAVKAIRCGIMQ